MTTGDPEPTLVTQGRLRALNLNIVFASLSAVGAMLVSVDAGSWVEALVLVTGLVAALVAVGRWTAERGSRAVLPCLVLASAVWFFGLATGSTTAVYGLAVVGTVVVHRLPRHRRAAALGLVGFVVAGAAVRLVSPPGDLRTSLVHYVVVPAAVAAVAVLLTSLHQPLNGLITELEEARAREAELAVARERIRFAGDLHDIQGHTLHVVRLKVALARRLLPTDPARVEQELAEVADLVGETITQTKELASAQRRLNLSAELENARNLFEAAGITVGVERGGGIGLPAGEMLAQVLRETTTNILRHAQATRVGITLSGTGLVIENDGARDDGPPELRGLATLRERLAQDGAELVVRQEGGRFRTAVTLPNPAPRSSAPPSATTDVGRPGPGRTTR